MGVIIAIIGTYYIGSGFVKESAAYIENYTVSADGSEMTIDVGVAASMGYIRKVSVHQQDGGKLYLDCYSAFGGHGGSWGAKSTYTIPLDETPARRRAIRSNFAALSLASFYLKNLNIQLLNS